MTSLSACATAASDPPRVRCPALKEYSRADQARVADELLAANARGQAAGRLELWPSWIGDYGQLRGACRDLK
jgi:hypothetical protein